MNTVDYIVIAIIALVVGFAIRYVCRAKKKGVKCIGCPDSCACSKGNCAGGCNGCCE